MTPTASHQYRRRVMDPYPMAGWGRALIRCRITGLFRAPWWPSNVVARLENPDGEQRLVVVDDAITPKRFRNSLILKGYIVPPICCKPGEWIELLLRIYHPDWDHHPQKRK